MEKYTFRLLTFNEIVLDLQFGYYHLAFIPPFTVTKADSSS